MRHLLKEVLHGFYHFEHGIFQTFRDLAQRPGPALRDYLAGKRVGWYNAFTFILVTGGIAGFVFTKFHWQSFFVDLGILRAGAINEERWEHTISHFSLRLLLSIPLYAMVSFLLYRKTGYNFSEHLIANTYLRGEMNVFMLLLFPLDLLVRGGAWHQPVALLLAIGLLVYMGWALNGVFGKKQQLAGWTKGFICALLSLSLEMLVVNAIAFQ